MKHDEQYEKALDDANDKMADLFVAGESVEKMHRLLFDAGIAYARKQSSSQHSASMGDIKERGRKLRAVIDKAEPRGLPPWIAGYGIFLNDALAHIEHLESECATLRARPRIPRELWGLAKTKADQIHVGLGHTASGFLSVIEDDRRVIRDLLLHVQPEEEGGD